MTTVVPGAASMRSWASINQPSGARCVRRSCVSTRCAARVSRVVAWCQRLSLTTLRPSRTAVRALTRPTCRRCASHVTTERQHARPQVGADHSSVGGRGSQSLQTAARDACACTDFCACKLKTIYYVRFSHRGESDCFCPAETRSIVELMFSVACCGQCRCDHPGRVGRRNCTFFHRCAKLAVTFGHMTLSTKDALFSLWPPHYIRSLP